MESVALPVWLLLSKRKAHFEPLVSFAPSSGSCSGLLAVAAAHWMSLECFVEKLQWEAVVEQRLPLSELLLHAWSLLVLMLLSFHVLRAPFWLFVSRSRDLSSKEVQELQSQK
jgi:hypothetical protein